MLNACCFRSHLLGCDVLVIMEEIKINYTVMKVTLITWFVQLYVSVRAASPFLSLDDVSGQ